MISQKYYLLKLATRFQNQAHIHKKYEPRVLFRSRVHETIHRQAVYDRLSARRSLIDFRMHFRMLCFRDVGDLQYRYLLYDRCSTVAMYDSTVRDQL